MKKILFCCLFMCISFLMVAQSYAQEVEPELLSKNHLDLKNLTVPINGHEKAFTRESIHVKINTTYTLILSYGFIGQHVSYISELVLALQNAPTYNWLYLDFEEDPVNQMIYLEFTTATELINLKGIPASPNSHEATLIEGNYASFQGFMPYVYETHELQINRSLLMDYDHRLSLEDIKSYIIAKNRQGTVIGYDVTHDGYTNSSQLPGTYTMHFLTMQDNMYQLLKLEIRVLDITPPVLSFSGENITVAISNKLTLTQIKALIHIHDNVDVLQTEELNILSDTYSAAQKIGSYQITFGIEDYSGNFTSLSVPVLLVDTDGPWIEGPYTIFIYTEDQPFTNQQIIDFYEIYDDIDGNNVVTVIEINQYNQTKEPGKYKIRFSIRDQQFNYTFQDIYIEVVNNSAPYFELNDLMIQTDTISHMTEPELIEWFKTQLSAIGVFAKDVEITFNEYEMRKSQSGSYYVYMSYQADEQTQISRILIQVDPTPNPIKYVIIFTGIASILGLTVFILIKKFKK